MSRWFRKVGNRFIEVHRPRRWKWKIRRTVVLDKVDSHPPWQPPGSEARRIADLWRELSLGNVAEITSRVPGWFDDDEIADAILEARRRYLLPWEYSAEEWEELTCKIKLR